MTTQSPTRTEASRATIEKEAVEAQDRVTSYLFDEVSAALRAGKARLKNGIWEMPLVYGLSGVTPVEIGVIRMDPSTSTVIFPPSDLKAARDYVRRRAAAKVPPPGV